MVYWDLKGSYRISCDFCSRNFKGFILIYIYKYKVGPQTIAELVNITPITIVYGTSNLSYWGFQTNLELRGPTLYKN